MNIKIIYKKFISIFKDFVDSKRIEKLYFEDKFYECIDLCNSLIKNGSTDFFAYYYLGLANAELNHTSESTTNLKTAINLPDTDKSKKAIKSYRNFAKYQLAKNLIKQRNYNSALTQVDQNIIDDPAYSRNYILKAQIQEYLDDIIGSIDSINEGLKINPADKDLIESKNRLVYIYSVEQSKKRNS